MTDFENFEPLNYDYFSPPNDYYDRRPPVVNMPAPNAEAPPPGSGGGYNPGASSGKKSTTNDGNYNHSKNDNERPPGGFVGQPMPHGTFQGPGKKFPQGNFPHPGPYPIGRPPYYYHPNYIPFIFPFNYYPYGNYYYDDCDDCDEYDTHHNHNRFMPPFPGFPQQGPQQGPQFNGPSQNPPLKSPPNYVPNKKDAGVQSFNQKGPNAKAVSPGSINFCLNQFAYIWETSGRGYWAFILRVDRVSVSGFRWIGMRWVYFGVDLRRIDSFVCYRDSDRYNNIYTLFRIDDFGTENNKIEYSLDDTREVYTKNLAEISIPEIKDDFIIETIGDVEDTPVETKYQCTLTRVTSYRINLEVSIKAGIKDDIKEDLLRYVDEIGQEIIDSLSNSNSRDKDKHKHHNPLELFEVTLKTITDKMGDFSNMFTHKLQKLPYWKEISKVISFKIVKEKVSSKWKRL